jgi:hypothetical protein
MKHIISFEENVKIVYEEAEADILKFTPQLFITRSDKSKSIKQFGSSVLFSRNGFFYLITAAHCIAQENELIKIGVMIQGNFYFIKGYVFLKKGIDDKIDLGIVRLETETVELLKLSYDFLGDNHILNQNVEQETEYLIVGYPISKTSIDYKRKKILHEPLLFISKSKAEDAYNKRLIKSGQNILLGFNRRKSSFIGENEMNMSPVPTGISGCGLWYIPSYFSEKTEFKLAGIMIEYYDKENMVLATKIRMVMELIEPLENIKDKTTQEA